MEKESTLVLGKKALFNILKERPIKQGILLLQDIKYM